MPNTFQMMISTRRIMQPSTLTGRNLTKKTHIKTELTGTRETEILKNKTPIRYSEKFQMWKV